MVTSRRGRIRFGCLLQLIILAGVLYFGTKVATAYWHFSQYKDLMAGQARFADHFTDDQIRKRLAASVDSLGLPPEAADVTITRTGRHISIAADYSEMIQLPLKLREFKFAPRAESDY